MCWTCQFFRNEGLNSYGCCLLNSAGQFVKASIGWRHPELQIIESEAATMLNGMHWVQEMGLHHVIFVTDSQIS